jgi:hypothetical protein
MSVGAAGSFALAGCSGDGGDGGNGDTGNGDTGGDTPTDGGGTATDSGMWPDLTGDEVHILTENSLAAHRAFYDRVASGFQEATGAVVNVEYVGAGAGGTERVTQLSQGGNPPELHQAVSSEIAGYKNAGIAEPVTDLVETIIDEVHGPVKGGEKNRLIVDGEDYLIPFVTYYNNWYYRTDLADIVPDTYEKALEYAQQTDSEEIHGVYQPASANPVQTYDMLNWMYTHGGQFCEWDGDQVKIIYDEGENRDKLIEAQNKRAEMYQYSPDTTGGSFGEWSNGTGLGVAASGGYTGFRPHPISWRRDRDFKEDLASLGGYPVPSGGSNTPTSTTIGWATFKGANTEAAKAYVEYLFRNHYVDFCTTVNPGHYSPSFAEVQTSEKYKEELLSTFEDRGWGISWDKVRKYQSIESLPIGAEIQPKNPAATASYRSPPFFELASRPLVEDVDPGTVIDEVAEEHQAEIDQALGQ